MKNCILVIRRLAPTCQVCECAVFIPGDKPCAVKLDSIPDSGFFHELRAAWINPLYPGLVGVPRIKQLVDSADAFDFQEKEICLHFSADVPEDLIVELDGQK